MDLGIYLDLSLGCLGCLGSPTTQSNWHLSSVSVPSGVPWSPGSQDATIHTPYRVGLPNVTVSPRQRDFTTSKVLTIFHNDDVDVFWAKFSFRQSRW